MSDGRTDGWMIRSGRRQLRRDLMSLRPEHMQWSMVCHYISTRDGPVFRPTEAGLGRNVVYGRPNDTRQDRALIDRSQ
jgi:hypothetical protein